VRVGGGGEALEVDGPVAGRQLVGLGRVGGGQ
jgi:hypothetical protein